MNTIFMAYQGRRKVSRSGTAKKSCACALVITQGVAMRDAAYAPYFISARLAHAFILGPLSTCSSRELLQRYAFFRQKYGCTEQYIRTQRYYVYQAMIPA